MTIPNPNPLMTLESMKDRSEFGQYLTAAGYTGTGVEVGVFRGEFAHQILSTWGGYLYGIDSYNNGEEVHLLEEARNLNTKYEHRYEIVVCLSIHGPSWVPDGLDFVFLDADHSADAVAADIKAWYPKIRHGGLLCGHDYDEKEPGVRTAVDEFLAANPTLKMHHKPCGSWFIKKP